MLTLLANRSRFGDGLNRRSFLKIGSLGAAGLNLADLVRAENPAAANSRSVIMVYLSGGISHQDTVDLKPEAPLEVRGEFKPISTKVEGIHLCELLPRVAQVNERPIDYRDVLATVYHQLDIDANRLVSDRSGRPISILPGDRRPIAELL